MSIVLAVAIDDSQQSYLALEWALDNVKLQSGKLCIIAVMPPITCSVAPAHAAIATAGAMNAVAHQWEAQRRHDEAHAHEILQNAASLAHSHGMAAAQVETHALTACGGASGVGESIVEFVAARGVDAVVVGSRGMGSFKRSIMSLLGLGSVSDYCVHNLHCPVFVVRTGKQLAAASPPAPGTPPPAGASEPAAAATAPLLQAASPRKVCVAMDESPQAEHVLTWVREHVARATDEIHIVSVALPVPFPAQIVDEATAAVAAVESLQWERGRRESAKRAEAVCVRAVKQLADDGHSKSQLFFKALQPEGGASDVAASICRYAKDNHVSFLALGSRGFDSWKRSMMSLIGLGSVSDHCVHHLEMPVLVVKPHAANGNHAAAANNNHQQ